MSKINSKSKQTTEIRNVKKKITKVQENEAQEEADFKEKFGQIDSGVIEVALAVAAVSAFLITGLDVLKVKELVFALKLTAFLAFLLSSYGAGRIYFSYLIIKFPNLYNQVIKRGGFGGLIVHYLSLMIKMNTGKSWNDTQMMENEFGHLSILGAFLLIIVVIAIWFLISIYP